MHGMIMIMITYYIAHIMPGENTVEYQTILRCRERIKLAIQNDLTAVSDRMVEKGLITSDDSTELRNSMHSKANRASNLLDLLLPKINANEKNYKVFIDDILGANRYFYGDIIDHLEKEYDKLKGITLRPISIVRNDHSD